MKSQVVLWGIYGLLAGAFYAYENKSSIAAGQIGTNVWTAFVNGVFGS